MTSTQHLPCTDSKQLNRDIENRRFLKRGIRLFFCQIHSSRTNYQSRYDWLKYWINLVTLVPVNFQHRINLALNDWLGPQFLLSFSACTRHSK